jgi:hypothetical protein
MIVPSYHLTTVMTPLRVFFFFFFFPFFCLFVPRNGKGKSDYGAGIIAFRSVRVRFFSFKGGELFSEYGKCLLWKKGWSARDVREASDGSWGGGMQWLTFLESGFFVTYGGL